MVNIGEQAREVTARSQALELSEGREPARDAADRGKSPDRDAVENSEKNKLSATEKDQEKSERKNAPNTFAAELGRKAIGVAVRNDITSALFTPNTQAAVKHEVLDARSRIRPKGNEQDLTEKETGEVLQKAYGLSVGITGGALLNGIFDQNEADTKKDLAVDQSRGPGLAATLAKAKEAMAEGFNDSLDPPARKAPARRSRNNEGPEL